MAALATAQLGWEQFVGRYFEENYQLLKYKLDRMGVLVQELLNLTVQALTQRDVEVANRTLDADEAVDRMEVEIDELVLKLLALQQPMAIDLRFLMTALKINNDLERMADQAVNISEGVLTMSRQEQAAENLVDFSPMVAAVQEMVRDCIIAFTSGDVDLARRVVNRDDEVDEMNRLIINDLAAHLQHHPADANRCMSLLLITRNLERIGDLSTNIAEDVVYYIEGKIIKHMHAAEA